MKSDPMDGVAVGTIFFPPSHGPGSGKDAWRAFALNRDQSCNNLLSMVAKQSTVIKELQAEIRLLQEQIAKRKPTGGRPKIGDQRVAEIERDLLAGYSTRQIAVRCGVSAMTVSRIAARVVARRVA